MNLTKTQVILFFVALVLLGWFLYPRTLFLGYMYEGTAGQERAEKYYLSYLEKKPNDKFAMMRLANLYERMGEPQKATQLWQQLYSHRKGDWDVAQKYMDHLENRDEEEGLFRTRIDLARTLIGNKRIPRTRIEGLLYDALLYARWKQRPQETIEILNDLIRVAKNPRDHVSLMMDLDRGWKHREAVVKALEDRLNANEDEIPTRAELGGVYIVLNRFDDARRLIDRGLELGVDPVQFLTMRVGIDEKTGNASEWMADLEKLLKLVPRKGEDHDRFTETLASVYAANGRRGDAILLYKELLELDRNNQKHWKTLAGIYLYDMKDLGQLPFYLEYVTKFRVQQFAMDVAFTLFDARRYEDVGRWCKAVTLIFPSEYKLADVWMEALSRRKDYGGAVAVGKRFLARVPNHADAVLRVAQLGYMQGDSGTAQIYYERYAQLKPQDPSALKLVGTELFFLGRAGRAESYLGYAAAIAPNDSEIWHWLSEISAWRGDTQKARERATQVVGLLAGREDEGSNMLRMSLKARGRLGLGKEILPIYEDVTERHPKNSDLRADLIDLLLERRKRERAAAEIEKFVQSFPKEAERIAGARARLAILEEDWPKAVEILEGIVARHPGETSYRRDLAEGYAGAGRWKTAVRIFEEGKREGCETHGEDSAFCTKIASLLLRSLHDRYDRRLDSRYRVVDFGDDRIMEGTVVYKDFAGESVKLSADATAGNYVTSAFGFDGVATHGKVAATIFSPPHWTFTGRVGFGASNLRATASPGFEVRYRHGSRFDIGANYDYRTLRADLPQAVAAGTLQDAARFDWSYSPVERLNFNGKYSFERNYLPGGATGYEHTVEPSVSYTMLRKPQISIGYQFTYSQVADRNGFLAQVPLLPKVSAHYLTASVNHRFSDNLAAAGGFFIGEDTARDLHLFEADLFGLRGSFLWNMLSWLDLEAAYYYGRETRTTLAGRSHQGVVTLSGHWGGLQKSAY